MTACFHTHKFKQKVVSQVSGETRKVVRLVTGSFRQGTVMFQESQKGKKKRTSQGELAYPQSCVNMSRVVKSTKDKI